MKEKLKRDKALKATQKIMPLVVSKEEVKTVNQTQDNVAVDTDEFCGPSIGMRILFTNRMICMYSVEDIPSITFEMNFLGRSNESSQMSGNQSRIRSSSE